MHVICNGNEETLQVSKSKFHDLEVRGEVASSPGITDYLEWSPESYLTRIARLEILVLSHI